MTTTQPHFSREVLARRGVERYAHEVRPLLQPADEGKFIAIEVTTGAFEIDEDEYAAVTRLHQRVPGAQVWLVRAGYPTAHRLRGVR